MVILLTQMKRMEADLGSALGKNVIIMIQKNEKMKRRNDKLTNGKVRHGLWLLLSEPKASLLKANFTEV